MSSCLSSVMALVAAFASHVDAQAVLRDRLGLELSVASSLVRRNIISTSTPYGFLVAKVAPDSAAARAGLKAGDIVLEWDGAPIRTVQQLAEGAARLSSTTADCASASIRYSRKRPNVRLTFPATDPWETRCTRIRAAAAQRKRGRPI